MCGIFGVVTSSKVDLGDLKSLAQHSKRRGSDSSGMIYFKDDKYYINRADFSIDKLLKKTTIGDTSIALGHSRLITNGLADNQPVVRENVCVLHNGIIVNDQDVWKELKLEQTLKIDTEAIVGVVLDYLRSGADLTGLAEEVSSKCKGVINSAILIKDQGKLVLMSNNGSLYVGQKNGGLYFASEKYTLEDVGCTDIEQISRGNRIHDVPVAASGACDIKDIRERDENLIPEFVINKNQEGLLIYPENKVKRCTKCVLPETMPYLAFDEKGVCNYCKSYKSRNSPKPKEELFKVLEPFRRKSGTECVVPFSGGRDSCFALHLIVNELKMKPVAYTYDWGMVTDLGRRNISRMCSQLEVENIIVAADISLKRKNIRMNLEAWLKSPHLGMMALLTAGDKHFFQYIDQVREQTGVSLNLWGFNPLEVTHFKTGFLGIKPDFVEQRVYNVGLMKQLVYHSKRFKLMTKSMGYFNSSLWDTMSGEYYRSINKKVDYHDIFDFWLWDEDEINDTLINQYDWEVAPDTSATWRIGDGTAAFYNYVYRTVAGFSEHDTFRSNQIREGQLTREKALELIDDENQPRYQNIRWYLDTLGLDFDRVIKVVNDIPRMY